jgi:hypothetical protein
MTLALPLIFIIIIIQQTQYNLYNFSISNKPRRKRNNAIKEPKYSIDPSYINECILSRNCDHRGSENQCLSNFSINDIIWIRKKICYLENEKRVKNEKEMYQVLIYYLKLHQVQEKSKESHKIGEGIYDLTFKDIKPNIHLCVYAFTRIIGISIKKIEKASFMANYGTELDNPTNLKLEFKEKYQPKTMTIKSFLKWFYDNMSIELHDDVDYDKKENSLKLDNVKYCIGCYERKDFFNEFQIRCSEVLASESWFFVTWKKYFPHLHLMHDRACLECDELVEKIREAERSNVVAVSGLVYQLEQHRNNDNRLKEYVAQKIANSKLSKFNNGVNIIFTDHWGSKLIASKSSLVEYKKISNNSMINLHSSGLYNSTTKESVYMVYNQPYEESTNIILNHIQLYLNQKLSKEKLTKLYFIADTHSTQRSNLLICYFDYLVRILQLFGLMEKFI